MLEAPAYWRNPLKPMMSSRQLTEFYILDAEATQQGEQVPAFCEAAMLRSLSCASLLLPSGASLSRPAAATSAAAADSRRPLP